MLSTKYYTSIHWSSLALFFYHAPASGSQLMVVIIRALLKNGIRCIYLIFILLCHFNSLETPNYFLFNTTQTEEGQNGSMTYCPPDILPLRHSATYCPLLPKRGQYVVGAICRTQWGNMSQVSQVRPLKWGNLSGVSWLRDYWVFHWRYDICIWLS